jgi:drug/metabolite transporter (DMT)-like permease
MAGLSLSAARENSAASTRSSRLGGVALAALGAIAFSGKAIIVKLAYRHGVDAVTLIALRMAVALPFFAWISIAIEGSAKTEPLLRSDWPKIFVLGVLGYYLASYLDFLGLAYITATLERLILYLNPTLVLAIGVFWFKRRILPRQWLALALSYAGVVLALTHDFRLGGSNIALGSILVFGSAVTYALYLVGSGEMVKRVGPLRLTAHASCVASLCCIVQFALTRPVSALTLPHEVYWLSLINGVACTVLPVFAVMFAIARVGAPTAAQIGMIGPVSTIIFSWLLLGEAMGVTQVVGTFLVVGGVFIVSQGSSQGEIK